MIAAVAAHTYCTLEALLDTAKQRNEAPLLVLCDELADPHNLGAIIRTAECAGAHGVVITKRRSVGLTAVVDKSAAGALEYMPVARVTNLTQAIQTLKKMASGCTVRRWMARVPFMRRILRPDGHCDWIRGLWNGAAGGGAV